MNVPVVLGTVQLGTAYGVANRTGKPDYATALQMIEAALEEGISAFDTAAAYGDSEVVLGRALRDLGSPEVTVVTKVQPQAGAALRAAVELSAQRLGVERIPVVLTHREPEQEQWESLLEIRDDGLIGRAGVSVGHDPIKAGEWVSRPELEVVQIPISVLDHRHDEVLQVASQRQVEVHARSVFLQGLLLMPEEDIPANLAPAIPVRARLAELAHQVGISLPELAIRYVLGLPGNIQVVLGCETVEQVRQNARLAAGGPLAPDVHELVSAAVPSLPAEVLTPGLWGHKS